MNKKLIQYILIFIVIFSNYALCIEQSLLISGRISSKKLKNLKNRGFELDAIKASSEPECSLLEYALLHQRD